MAKKQTKEPVETTETPIEVTEAVVENEKDKDEAKKQTKEPVEKTGKVYKFTSKNRFLTVGACDVQFIDGKAETSNLEVARILAKIDGVTLVEE